MFKDLYDFLDKKVIFRIFLKGFLYRIDYLSFVGISVEEVKINNFFEKVEVYLKSKCSFIGFKDF